MERRELVSWLLPLFGLSFTAPEIVKLARDANPDLGLLGLFTVMSIFFVARLGVLAKERRTRG